MSQKDEIIANTMATMAMEDMPLSDEDVAVLDARLSGKVSFEDAIAAAVKEFRAS